MGQEQSTRRSSMDKYYRELSLDSTSSNYGQGGTPKRGYRDGDAPSTPYMPSPEALQINPFSYSMPGGGMLVDDLQQQMHRQGQQSQMAPHAQTPWGVQHGVPQQMMGGMNGYPGIQGGGEPPGLFNMQADQGQQQQPGMVNISPFAPRSQTAGQLINVGGTLRRAPTAEEDQARAFWM